LLFLPAFEIQAFPEHKSEGRRDDMIGGAADKSCVVVEGPRDGFFEMEFAGHSAGGFLMIDMAILLSWLLSGSVFCPRPFFRSRSLFRLLSWAVVGAGGRTRVPKIRQNAACVSAFYPTRRFPAQEIAVVSQGRCRNRPVVAGSSLKRTTQALQREARLLPKTCNPAAPSRR